MQYIEMQSGDVFQNLATEEYILNHFLDDSYLLLYRNEDSLVLGKYQNAYQEINVPAVETAGIKVVRRISGGGTVFHDSGNINYAFLTSTTKAGPPTYDMFLAPVISALRRLGIHAQKRNICDIAIGDKKISGSAQAIHGNRVLHHGTLLFHADMEKLHRFLKVTDALIDSKAVPSVPSPVTNIREHLTTFSVTVEDFKTALFEQLTDCGCSRRKLTTEEELEIFRLRDEKYNTWEWNWGKSPRFTLRRNDVELKVDHGIITACSAACMPDEVSRFLPGQRYGYQNMIRLLTPYFGENANKVANRFF